MGDPSAYEIAAVAKWLIRHCNIRRDSMTEKSKYYDRVAMFECRDLALKEAVMWDGFSKMITTLVNQESAAGDWL